MPRTRADVLTTAVRDLTAGIVVFLVALPLCLGIALASNAPLFSGVLAGIIGGLVIGALSGSHTSVSGPAAGLTAVVAAQIATLGSFEAFLLAVVIAGLIQIAMGLARGGFIAAFFPSAVIKGLLAAIGVILILKQIPHLLGHDIDPEGEMSFQQPDHESTFSEFGELLNDIHPGATVIGLISVALLVIWDNSKRLKKSGVPAPLVVVLLGVAISLFLKQLGGRWVIQSSHLVQVPLASSLSELRSFLQFPDFSQWQNPAIYTGAFTIAIVASLETLLNLEAIDKLDPKQRTSPASRELVAQGVGNTVSGLIGGLPMTSVIIRSSVNVHSGAQTKCSAIFHGILLLGTVAFLPAYLNMIPLASLAAILLVTGFKLASPTLIRQMWQSGRFQFLPFAFTVISIVLTDLLVGVVIGLIISLGFILWSNVRHPMRRIVEKHPGGEVVHIVLANQVSFLNRAALDEALNAIPRGGQVLLDAQATDYIDPDILSLIKDFRDHTAPARGVRVSLLGFRRRYQLHDQTQFVDYTTRELQDAVTPDQVLQILKDGHARFRSGQWLTRDLARMVGATANSQHPLAVVLSCIDSRVPVELLFDLGLGDIFSVRIAGNIVSPKVLGSIEYGCAVARAKLILVLGHTRCGAVTAAVDLVCSDQTAAEATGCDHLDQIVSDIQQSIDPRECTLMPELSPEDKESLVNGVARRNVARTVNELLNESQTLNRLVREGRIRIVGAMYDVVSGELDFLSEHELAGAKNAVTSAD